jgi:hypothetical protein
VIIDLEDVRRLAHATVGVLSQELILNKEENMNTQSFAGAMDSRTIQVSSSPETTLGGM